jgi:hypothetical protein
MPKSSRREFLVVAGTGAAAAGVLAAVPGSAEADRARVPSGASPLVVHVPDPSGAELVVHQGDRTGVVRDRDLVVRLLAAAGKRG